MLSTFALPGRRCRSFSAVTSRLSAMLVAHLCFGGTAPAQEVVDSAGVQIVTNEDAAWTSATEPWTISEGPVQRFGGPSSTLWQIHRIARAPSGEVAVLSRGTSTIQVFSPDGELLVEFGSEGRGPGEFESPVDMALASPDTVLVLDRGAIEIFTLDGQYVRTESIPAWPGVFESRSRALPSRVGSDGYLLYNGGAPVRDIGPGVIRPSLGLAVAPDPQSRPAVIGWYEGSEQELRRLPGGGLSAYMAPFARSGLFGVGPPGDSRFFVADNGRYEIRLYDREGALRRIVRRTYEPVEVQDEWVEAWKRRQLENPWIRSRRAQYERAWRDMQVHETLPAFDHVVIDELGYLWVLQAEPVRPAPPMWDVFSPEGIFLGEVRGPEKASFGRPFTIGADYIIGVSRGSLGIETVELYELSR